MQTVIRSVVAVAIAAAVHIEIPDIQEEKLLAITQHAAGCEMETWAYVDMDHDGSEELIGVCREDGS